MARRGWRPRWSRRTRLPVTAKLRLGWDAASEQTAPAVAHALAGVGIQLVTVHGRTRAQAFAGAVDREGIRRVVERSPVPVIANGDVLTVADARAMLEATGARGLMIGRGVIEDPWLIRDVAATLAGDPVPAPSFARRAGRLHPRPLPRPRRPRR